MVFFVWIGREIGFVREVGSGGIWAKELEAECKAWVRPQIRNAGSMALGLRRREAWLFRGDGHGGSSDPRDSTGSGSSLKLGGAK